MDSPEGDVGDRALELSESLYAELHRRAERLMRGQPPGATLQATALVHEGCLKLLGPAERLGLSRDHLLALASKAMRCVLIDRARARNRMKRAAPGVRLALDDLDAAYGQRGVDVLLLDETLGRLEAFDPRMARAVELRTFGGLSMAETARLLGMSLRTLEREWQTVRAWLSSEMEG